MHFPHLKARTSSSNRHIQSALTALFLLTFTFFIPSSAHAQYRASIQGTVTDQQGGVIPGAKLTLTNLQTNEKQERTSSEVGVYNFGALPPSTFKLVVEKEGFQTKVMDNLHIIPEQPNSIDVKLDVGAAAQTVTVDASATPLIDTATASIGGTISEAQIQNMPSFGRDVFQLTQFAPGTISDMSQGSGGGTFKLPGVQGPGGTSSNGGIFSTENGPQAMANGGQYQSNGISIDGISTASAVWGGTSVITPSEESVDNVHVLSNAYDAEYGRFSGAQIQVTSKAGSNTPHGSAFFQRWSPGLNAYQRYNGTGYYKPGTPSDRGLLRNEQQFNQYGASLGGPIWKDKIFAFFAYEGQRSGVINNTSTGWYETSAFDKLAAPGPIAASYLAYPGAGVNGVLIDQSCIDIGLNEGANCRTIPGQGLDVGSPMTGVAPGAQDPTWTGPSSPGIGGGLDGVPDIANYTTINPTTIADDQYNGRVDYNLTAKDRLTGTIYWVPYTQTYYSGPVRPMNFWHHEAVNDAFSGIWNHIFSPRVLNEARANAAGWRWNEVSTNSQAPFGLPQDNIGSIGSATLQNFGAPGPSILNQWTYTYRDIVTVTAGRHTIKLGGELTRLYYLNARPDSARPQFGFFNLWDFLNDAPKSENGTFDPATGTPALARQDNRQNLWGFFGQDDFKITPSLTLNMGLRYSYFGPLSSKQANMYRVRFGTGTDLLTGLNVQRGSTLWTPQKLNFSPEFGFTWSPAAWKDRLVIRGGYGLNYNQEEVALTANVFGNPGITVSPNFTMDTPSAPNPGILYATATNIHSLYGYPSNPAVVATSSGAFNSQGLPTASPTQVTAFPSKLPTIYVEHYSLDTQYDLGFRSVLTVGYQGSVSRHNLFHYDANAVASVQGLALNPQANSVNFWNNNGTSNYNSMIVTLNHQMSHQFQAEAQFNWAKSMDTSSGPYEQLYYPYDLSLDYGRSDYDVGKSLKIFGMWQPVFFHGSHAWAEKIVGGWNISGIFNLHTGFPWTPTFTTGSAGTPSGSLYCSTCGYTQLMPAAYLGGAHNNTSNDAYKSGPNVGSGVNQNFPLAASNTGTAYFAPPAFTPGPAFPATGGAIPQRPGIRRNSIVGPGYKDVDATVSKTFGVPKLREGSGITIRADAFNVFNNLNFVPGGAIHINDNSGGVANDISLTNFGQATKALGARTITLQARFNF